MIRSQVFQSKVNVLVNQTRKGLTLCLPGNPTCVNGTHFMTHISLGQINTYRNMCEWYSLYDTYKPRTNKHIQDIFDQYYW